MSYSQDDLFDDVVRGVTDMSTLENNLAGVHRLDRAAEFVMNLAMAVTETNTPIKAIKDLLLLCTDIDEVCILARVMGDIEIVGNIPEDTEIRLTKKMSS